MKNPWFTIFTLLVDEFIPLVEHVFEFINSFSESRSYFTFTWVDVPIPTDWLGTIFNVMNSPLSRPWAVESPIVDTTISNLNVIWLTNYIGYIIIDMKVITNYGKRIYC